MTDQCVEHFRKFGYVTLATVQYGAVLSSYQFSPTSKSITDIIAVLCNAECNVQIVFNTNDDTFFIHAVDPDRLGESQMPETMPTFKDFVADEIARFIALRRNQLSGDEDVEFILSKLQRDIAEGNWKNYIEVTTNHRKRSS